MLLVLLLVLASAGFAQSTADASALLQRVADNARDANSWMIEGSIEFGSKADGPPASFTLLMRAPDSTHFEQIGGTEPATVVCNTGNAWVYSSPLNRYKELTAPRLSTCLPIGSDWKLLPSILNSPALAGRKAIDVGGQTFDCELVRGSSEPELHSAGRLKRTLCIDISRNVIVWEKVEDKYSSRTYTYRHVERDADIPDGAFRFTPPAGSTSTPYDLPFLHPLGSPAMPLDAGVSTPRLISKKDPSYDPASRKAKIQGTVVLYVVIDTSGVPSDVEVFRPLSPGLDSEAIRSIRQWRFAPGMKGDQPVALSTLIEVNFKLF